MTQGYIKLDTINQVGYITFFHPSSNALPSYLLKELADKIQQAGTNPEIKSIVLQSEGRTFCAGASFDELLALKNEAQAVAFFMGFARVINAMRENPKFIIAKVQGKAVGGGVGLIAAADYALATDKAAVKLSELSIGIGPYVIAPAVKRKMGQAAFSEMAINATKWHTAFWAREKSLFAQVVDHQDDLNEAAETLSEKLARYDVNATRLLKHEIWTGTENWPNLLAEKAQLSARLVLQDFTKTFLKNFKKL